MQDWYAAFRSLYYNLIYGACERFYLKTAWCFCIFSGSPKLGEEPVAVLTGPNQAQRDELAKAGVEFATPLHRPGEPSGKRDLTEDEKEAERLRSIMNVSKKKPKE